MRKNGQSGDDFWFAPGTEGDPLSLAVWPQTVEPADRRDPAPNGRNEHPVAVPPFDWHVSEALMRCYNG